MNPFLALAMILPLASNSVSDPLGSPPDRLERLDAARPLMGALGVPVETPTRLTPMQREIKAVLDSVRVRRENLVNEGSDIGSWTVELARLQRETRLQVLEIQERYAEREGRLDLARRLRRTMAEVRADRTALN
jgi:hypothetical protein